MLFDTDPRPRYESLHVIHDAASGLRALICVHSTALGPAAGGIRRIQYPNEAAALEDACRLARGMSLKNAMANLPAGGAKAVIMDHAGLDRSAAYHALGKAIDRLGGWFRTGPDVGTSAQDLAAVRKATPFVNAPSNDAGAATARGVLAALRATVHALDRSRELEGRTMAVQGLGDVGGRAALLLREAGARVVAADPNPEACKKAAAQGIRVVAPEKLWTVEADVLVPCALGGILSPTSLKTLGARAVCGSANNQLASADMAAMLHEAGIHYAPDFIANAGAVIEGVLTFDQGATDLVRVEAAKRIDAIEGTMDWVFAQAKKQNLPTTAVAEAEALQRIAAAQA